MHTLIFRALWVVIVVLAFVPHARADTISFYCRNEEATNQIAEALANEGQFAADAVAKPFMALRVCGYFDEPLFVYITHKGSTFGEVTVVGVSRKIGEFPEWWGMLPSKDIGWQTGSI